VSLCPYVRSSVTTTAPDVFTSTWHRSTSYVVPEICVSDGGVGEAASVPASRVIRTVCAVQSALSTMRSILVLPAPTALGMFTATTAVFW